MAARFRRYRTGPARLVKRRANCPSPWSPPIVRHRARPVLLVLAGATCPWRYTVPATTRVRKSGVSQHNAPTLGERLEAHMTTAGCQALAVLLASAALASCKTAPPPA